MIFKNANESIWDHYKYDSLLEVDKKTEKSIKLKKNNRKNQTVKKNQLKFWKNRPVWFRFYKPETEKNRGKPKKPSQTEKPSQAGLNLFCPKKSNRTETSRFEPVLVFFQKKKSIWLLFLIKTELNRKWSPPFLMDHYNFIMKNLFFNWYKR